MRVVDSTETWAVRNALTTLAVGLVLALANPIVVEQVVAGEQQAVSDDKVGSLPESERPQYGVLRYNEDWSVLAGLDRTATGDFFDPIKYIPIWEERDVWASLGGQTRLRFEGWNNFNFGSPGNQDDFFLLTRFLYHADIHATEYLRGFVEGKSAFSTDRRLLGGRTPLHVDELDLQNGFLDIKVPVLEFGSLTVRSGRQELLFGKQRLVSPLDWANTRRTFDGFSGIFKAGNVSATGFYTQAVPVREYRFNQADAGTEFFGIYGTGKAPELQMSSDLYFLGLVRDESNFNGTIGRENRYTLGGRIGGLVSDTAIDYDLEGAYQFGRVGPGHVSAFMVTSEVGYRMKILLSSLRLHAAFGYASGDREAGGDVQTFNQLFPLGHAYLGFIDAVGRQNVVDTQIGLSTKPAEKFTIRLDGHYFWRPERADALYHAGGGVVRSGTGGTSRDVGAEIDLLLKFPLTRHIVGTLGYSHFFPGDFIRQSGSAKDIDFVYVEAQFTF